MKKAALILLVYCCAIEWSSNRLLADVIEVKGGPIAKTEKAGLVGHFQLKFQFELPETPTNANIDLVMLVIDQDFEMPVVESVRDKGPALDTTEVPKGFVNRAQKTVRLAVYGYDAKSGKTPVWVEKKESDPNLAGIGNLVPFPQVQVERKAGRWRNEAVALSVTDFVRQISKGSRQIEFVVGGEGNSEKGISSSLVDFDATKVSAKLLIYYTVPPESPHPFR